MKDLRTMVELNAKALTIDFDDMKKFPKGYKDGMLLAYDNVLMWMNEIEKNALEAIVVK